MFFLVWFGFKYVHTATWWSNVVTTFPLFHLELQDSGLRFCFVQHQEDRDSDGADLHGEAGQGQERRRLADDLLAALHPVLVLIGQLQRQRTDRQRWTSHTHVHHVFHNHAAELINDKLHSVHHIHSLQLNGT